MRHRAPPKASKGLKTALSVVASVIMLMIGISLMIPPRNETPTQRIERVCHESYADIGPQAEADCRVRQAVRVLQRREGRLAQEADRRVGDP